MKPLGGLRSKPLGGLRSKARGALRGLALLGMACSAGYYVTLLVTNARFFGRPPLPPAAEPPGVTILKPVKGVDDEAYANFASFCRQDYPAGQVQILFGVDREDDAVVPLVRRLQQEHPDLDVQLVIAARRLGANGKVSSLAQMLPHARHDLLAISDGDTRVGTDYLRCLAAPFADPAVGLATCPYRGAGPADLAAAVLALGINTEFVPSTILDAELEGLTFALGATVAIRRQALAAIGGFEALADHLADDYQLGNRTLRAGYRLALVPYVVDHVVRRQSLRDFFALQVRWARTVRVSRPAGYFASIVTHGQLFAAAYLALGGRRRWPGALLALRLAIAAVLSRRFLGSRQPLAHLALLPLRDALGPLFWALAFTGNRVTWRGRRYRLATDGRLTEE